MYQPPILPLTEENLLGLSSNNNEMLERYCQEMTLQRVRCQSTPPQLTTQQQQKNDDIVVASPRILPFPYHNDSMFLPTAEQIQYQMASSCYDNFSSSGTSRADSSSSIIPPSPSFMSRPKRPQSTNTNIRGSSNYSVSSISHHHHQHRGRRSLPARLDSLVMTNSLCKHKFLRRSSSCSSFGSSSVSSLEVVENNYAQQQQQQQQPVQPVPPQLHLSQNKKPWLKRIFKFFNKNTKQQQQQQQQHQDGNPVWYCQYSKNPTSRFEKYYNQKQMVIVS